VYGGPILLGRTLEASITLELGAVRIDLYLRVSPIRIQKQNAFGIFPEQLSPNRGYLTGFGRVAP